MENTTISQKLRVPDPLFSKRLDPDPPHNGNPLSSYSSIWIGVKAHEAKLNMYTIYYFPLLEPEPSEVQIYKDENR